MDCRIKSGNDAVGGGAIACGFRQFVLIFPVGTTPLSACGFTVLHLS
jgi:hypothetical protein